MNSHPLTEIEVLERAFERDEELMLATNYLAAFRSTPEGRAFVAAHMHHIARLSARYAVLVREVARVDQ